MRFSANCARDSFCFHHGAQHHRRRHHQQKHWNLISTPWGWRNGGRSMMNGFGCTHIVIHHLLPCRSNRRRHALRAKFHRLLCMCVCVNGYRSQCVRVLCAVICWRPTRAVLMMSYPGRFCGRCAKCLRQAHHPAAGWRLACRSTYNKQRRTRPVYTNAERCI